MWKFWPRMMVDKDEELENDFWDCKRRKDTLNRNWQEGFVEGFMEEYRPQIEKYGLWNSEQEVRVICYLLGYGIARETLSSYFSLDEREVSRISQSLFNACWPGVEGISTLLPDRWGRELSNEEIASYKDGLMNKERIELSLCESILVKKGNGEVFDEKAYRDGRQDERDRNIASLLSLSLGPMLVANMLDVPVDEVLQIAASRCEQEEDSSDQEEEELSPEVLEIMRNILK